MYNKYNMEEKKMLRFEYENGLYVVHENGTLKRYNKEDIEGSVVEEKHLENCNKHLVHSYRDILQTIKKDRNKEDKLYYMFVSNGYVLLALKEMFSEDINVKLFYKIESNEIKELIDDLFEIEENHGRIIISDVNNNFNFVMADVLLELFFTDADLRSSGEVVFKKFKLKSKNGKIRDIIAPHDTIKKPLQRLNTLFQKVYDKRNSEFQVAYKKGKNIKTNADIHTSNTYVYNIDLKDFYPSCKKELVDKYVKFLFKNVPNKAVVKDRFFNIILDNGGLFIGNPISGTLANAIISKPVAHIRNIAKKYDMEFSIYADDMTFSSEKFIPKEFVVNIFNHAFTHHGLENYFRINRKKLNGMSKNKRRITGVSINTDNQTTVARTFYRTLRVKIHKLSLGETANINLNKLRGQIAFAGMVDDSGKIYRLLEKFDATRKTYKLCSDEKMEELKGRVAK
jgi:RNA-directed DNA polymerase